VVLNFWASWCHPCREEFPLLRTATKDADGRYVVVGVATEDIRSDARSFAKQEHANWPNGFDVDRGVAKSYGVYGKPQTFFIDADGRIAAHDKVQLDDTLLAEGLAAAHATR